MRGISRFIGAVASAGLLATSVIAAAPVSAATTHVVPHTYTYRSLLVQQPVAGSSGATWAYANMTRTLTIRLIGPAPAGTAGLTGTVYKYTASISDSGRFATIPWKYAPNQGAFPGSRIFRAVGGSVWDYGNYGVFYANTLPNARPAGFVRGLSPTAVAQWPRLAFAATAGVSPLTMPSYGNFYNAAFQIHRTVVVSIKTSSKMTLSQIAAKNHMTVRALLRLNPKLAKYIGKTVPKGTSVRVTKVIHVTIHQHWAKTNYNGAGATFRAGNITGFAR